MSSHSGITSKTKCTHILDELGMLQGHSLKMELNVNPIPPPKSN